MKKRSKKGVILMENVIFIVLNLAYLSILILFLIMQGSGVTFMEEVYAKQIALVIDSAKPDMVVFINMEEAFDEVRENWGEEHIQDIIHIDETEHIVTVRLNKKSKGYSYAFFNGIKIINKRPDKRGEDNGFSFFF